MRVWLAWHHSAGEVDELSCEGVSEALCQLFGPLAGKRLRTRAFRQGPGRAIAIELPWVGWVAPFVQEDGHDWALAADYPVDAARVLGDSPRTTDRSAVLLRLCRELEREPSPLLEQLAPPYSVVWSSKGEREIRIQNDALGQSQVFEYRRDGLWAASNKINAFRALGGPATPPNSPARSSG